MIRKIKVGAVGIGRLGYQHAENIAFKIPNAELTAVCSRTMKKSVKVKEQLGAKYAYDDFNTFIENEELEAISITSHTRFHPEMILKALEKGLPVICEKPLAATHEESEKVIKEIKKKYPDGLCMMAFMRRYDPSYMVAKQEIKKGNIGVPILYKGYSGDALKVSEQAVDYLGEESEGIFYDFFVHDFDASRWLLESNWKKDSVSILGSNYHFKQIKNDFDNACCFAQFENDVMALYYCSRTIPHGYMIDTEIIGTESIVRVGSGPGKNLVQILNQQGVVKQEYEMFLDRFKDAYVNEMQEFVNCVAEGRHPEVTLDDALKASEMAMIANKLKKG